MESYCFSLCALSSLFWIIISHNYVLASREWPQHSLQYKLEVDHDEWNSPELSLLDTDLHTRHKRYVPESQPLDEYNHHEMFLNHPDLQDNVPSSRKTKDVKITEKTLTSDAELMDNSAARATVPTPTKPPVLPVQPTPANKSVIISAEFVNGMAPLPSPEPTSAVDISKYPDDTPPLPGNDSQIKEDFHMYYNSTFMVDPEIGQSYWIDMGRRTDVKVNNMLSKSYRRAATVKLSFDFPFYGHTVRNVTIATGGFLYTGDYVHSWLAATQYIAPLMANFDTSLSNDSYIKYVDNGTAFTVQWDKVVLQDKPALGEFTFQATLFSSGDIVFVYQNVPIMIEEIQDVEHPVKVGLSDAYLIDRVIFYVRKKTIYEYHRVNFNKEDIKNWTVIYLAALPTCNQERDCSSCVTANINFKCKWCPGMERCSTGMDRGRQDWLTNQCDQHEVASDRQCEELREATTQHSPRASEQTSPDIAMAAHSTRRTSSGYLGAAFFAVLLAGIAIWTMYAYNNPHSYSGQILIRYRPSQWSWRRGEARYTAATIHM